MVEWATYEPIDIDSERPLRNSRAHRAAKRSAATTRQGIRTDADIAFEEEGRRPLLHTLIGSESGVRLDVPLGNDCTTHRAGIALRFAFDLDLLEVEAAVEHGLGRLSARQIQ